MKNLRENNYEIKDLIDAHKEIIQRMEQITFCLKLLNRIRSCYPAIFYECVSEEDIKKIVEFADK